MSDSLYRQFLEHFADAFFFQNAQGRFVDINQAACTSLGYTREELLALSVQDIAVDHDQAMLNAAWAFAQPGDNYVVTDRHRRKDGSTLEVEVTVCCQEVNGEKCFFTMARNKTEQVRREAEIQQLNLELERQVAKRTQELKDSTHLLDAVMRGTSDIVLVKDLDGRYLFANPAATAAIGVAEGGLLGKTDAEVLGGDNDFAGDDAQVYASATPVVSDRHAMVGGQRRIFQSIKSQYRDEMGNIIGLLGIARDITHLRAAEHQLRMSYDSLRRAERLSRIGSWSLDLATGDFLASDMMYEMNGLDPNGRKVRPEDLQHMLRPEDYAKVAAAIDLCARTGQAYSVDVVHYTPDGGQFPACILGQADVNDAGQITSISGTVQDLSEREDARVRLEALADNLPSGAIYRLEDTEGSLRLSYISAGVENLVGVNALHIMADRSAYLATIHPDDRTLYDQKLQESMQQVQVFDHHFRIVRPDGTERWLRCRSAPRRLEHGTMWDGILLDITREREAEQALQQAKEAAEAAERAKSDFLATMSHEIRTPMNTVIGMTRLVQQTPLSPKQRNYLEKVELSANALLSIINDILDFSKIEAGMLALESVEFALDDILETVSAVTSLRAEEKGVEVVYAVAPDVPRLLCGDPLRLSQVLNNLVSNAIKFTHQGEVVFAIKTIPALRIQPAPAGTIDLQFSIKDTGIGLSADQIQQLFRPFAQADSQTTRRYGGTGLGLAICQRLIELMGGSLEVESAPGMGSTFHFHLRLRTTALAPAPRPVLYRANPGDRVLIVDDNASARDILGGMVRNFGMRADAVESGEKALASLQMASRAGVPYSLVLMDWRMPGMDGLEVARRIREEERLSTTPAVLMVTAYGRDEVLHRAEALRLQGLLIKPVTESVLFNAILDVLQSQNSGGAVPLASTTPAVAARDPAQLYPELAGRKVLVVDDNALNREVAADFLALVGIRVTAAQDGLDALHQLEQDVFDAVLMDVHMPNMDGLMATRILRQRTDFQQLPIIALTAQARQEDHAAIEAAGMDAHLTKPIDDKLLYDTLRDWLTTPRIAEPRLQKASAIADATAAPAADAPSSNGSPGILNLDPMRQRFGGNNARLERVLAGFYRDFAQAPQQLVAYAHQVDWASLGLLSHTIKGALGYLDAPLLAQQAAHIERQAHQWSIQLPNTEPPARILADCHAFSQQLNTLLGAIASRAAPPGPQHPMPPSGAALTPQDAQLALAHIRRLVADGDYAAVAALEDLQRHLPASALAPALHQVLRHVEDLEPDAALAALDRLEGLYP